MRTLIYSKGQGSLNEDNIGISQYKPKRYGDQRRACLEWHDLVSSIRDQKQKIENFKPATVTHLGIILFDVQVMYIPYR